MFKYCCYSWRLCRYLIQILLHPRWARIIAGAIDNLLHLSPSHLSVCLSVAEPASSPLCLMANQRSPSETGAPELHLLTYHPYCILSFVWIQPANHRWTSQYSNLIQCFVKIWYHFSKFTDQVEKLISETEKCFKNAIQHGCFRTAKEWQDVPLKTGSNNGDYW